MSTSKEYFAFISYKREDEKWAKWLQKELEGYHLPKKIAKANPNLSKEIRPIFRDTTELKSGKLKQQIEEALEASKYFIVICSPRAAQSVWVNRELETFIQKESIERVIPFIVEGTAFAKNTEEECYPSVLKHLTENQEILGANILEVGREAAKIKIIAHMLGVKFDALWNRYERGQKRKRRMWILTSCFITLCGLAIGGYFYKQNKIIDSKNKQLNHYANLTADHLKRIQKDSLTLSLKNDSIAMANRFIMDANDRISEQKNQLQNAYKDLELSQNNLKISNSNLSKTNFELKQSKDSLLISNIKTLSYIADINLANNRISEAYANLTTVDSLIEANSLATASYPSEYNNTLRSFSRFWETPGFAKISSRVSKEQYTHGAWFPNNNTFSDYTFENNIPYITTWDYMHDKEYTIDSEKLGLSSTYLNWLTNLGRYNNGNLLTHRNNQLFSVNLTTQFIEGVPIPFEGDEKYAQLFTSYSYLPSGKEIIITKDSTLYIGNLQNGILTILYRFPSRITNYEINPRKSNIIALTCNDSTLWIYDTYQKKIIQNKKITTNPVGITYHPNGNKLLLYGSYLILLYNDLTVADSISSEQAGTDDLTNISFAKFNNSGNRLFIDNQKTQSIWQYNAPSFDYEIISRDGMFSIKRFNNKFIIWDNDRNKRMSKWEIPTDNYDVLCFSEDNSHLAYYVYNNKKWTYKVLKISDGRTYNVMTSDVRYNEVVLSHNASHIIFFDDFHNKIYSYKLNSSANTKIKEINYSRNIYNLASNTILVSDDEKITELSLDLAEIYTIPIYIDRQTSLFNYTTYVNCICVNADGTHLYYSTNKGDIYKFELRSKKAELLLSCDFPIDEISVDDSERYLITHHSFVSWRLFIDAKQSYTKIWDIEKKNVVDDLSAFNLTQAKWLKGSTLRIDTGSYLLYFEPLNQLRQSLKQKFDS